LTPPPPATVRRRGPGRPSKAQTAAHFPGTKRPTGHSAVRLRRQMHNDSAMRSRARLNKALEELWSVVPNQERILQPENNVDDNREVCRAVKVEVAINYLKKLQGQLSGSQDGKHGA
jgi:Helix-loop-helix DNA-binding domain